MAIALILNALGMTAQQYDHILHDLEAKGLAAPDGRLCHIACAADDGWMVFDVWESEEKLRRFANILMPTIAAEGITLTQPRMVAVHNMIQ
jgi:hypothetical protein